MTKEKEQRKISRRKKQNKRSSKRFNVNIFKNRARFRSQRDPETGEMRPGTLDDVFTAIDVVNYALMKSREEIAELNERDSKELLNPNGDPKKEKTVGWKKRKLTVESQGLNAAKAMATRELVKNKELLFAGFVINENRNGRNYLLSAFSSRKTGKTIRIPADENDLVYAVAPFVIEERGNSMAPYIWDGNLPMTTKNGMLTLCHYANVSPETINGMLGWSDAERNRRNSRIGWNNFNSEVIAELEPGTPSFLRIRELLAELEEEKKRNPNPEKVIQSANQLLDIIKSVHGDSEFVTNLKHKSNMYHGKVGRFKTQ